MYCRFFTAGTQYIYSNTQNSYFFLNKIDISLKSTMNQPGSVSLRAVLSPNNLAATDSYRKSHKKSLNFSFFLFHVVDV